MVPSWVHVEPLFVEYWNVTVPVGVTPKTPEIVMAAVADPPREIGLVGFRVEVGAVGLALLTVSDAAFPVAPLNLLSPL